MPAAVVTVAVGAEVYPEPLLVITTLVTAPAVATIVATGYAPPVICGAENDTVSPVT